jgi:hypothetical protein
MTSKVLPSHRAFRCLSAPRRPYFSWRVAVFLFLSLQAVAALAHEKWLWPNKFAVEKAPAWISFDVTWSDQPFTADTGVGDRPVTVVDPEGRSGTPDRTFIGKTKTTCEAQLLQEGTYRLESVDPLIYWTQIEKDGQTQWLKKAKGEVVGETIKRSDLYWAKAMSYVTVGTGTALPAPLGSDPLSIALTQHPNQLFAGDTLTLSVQSYGKPVANAEIKVFDSNTSGHDAFKTIKCNDEGKGEFQVNSPGMYLFSCELEREVNDDPKADIHSFHVYLTLLVQSAKK